jgi:hypothetical protein
MDAGHTWRDGCRHLSRERWREPAYENIEELALVLVNALDLTIEDAVAPVKRRRNSWIRGRRGSTIGVQRFLDVHISACAVTSVPDACVTRSLNE